MVYFCNAKVKTLRIDNIWNFATLNLYSVPAKILYIQRYSTYFRTLRISSKMFRVGILLGGFRCAGILPLQWQGENFAHRQHLKFCHIQPVHCASKNANISKGIQPIFEIFPFARRCWGCAFGWKILGAHVFYFCNAKVKILRLDNNWNFATFNLYTVPAKIVYLQRYSTDFQKLRLSLKMLRVGIWEETFTFVGILLLQWQGENFVHRQHLKICHFQPVHCASKNPVSPKLLNRFSKSWPQLEDVEGGHSCGNIHLRRYFNFAMARWKLCASTTIEILPLSTCTLCQQKYSISKGIQPIFEIFASARRCWGWASGWKHSLAQVVYFCSGKVKTLRIDTIWNFATFNLYTVPAKILYLQSYWTDFRNLGLSSKMLRVGICREVSTAQVSYFCNGKVKTFRIDNIWNFATFNLYTVPAIIKYLQMYSTDFRNLSLCSKMLRVCIWLKNFRCAGVLLLQCQSENFAHRQQLKFCNFQPVHCASKNRVSPKVFNRFSKSTPQLEDGEGGHLGGNIHLRRYFTFAMARWKLCESTPFEILPLSTCTLCQQKSYISKVIEPIFEILASARRCWGWAFAGKFQQLRYLTFAMARWKLFASTTFEILPLSTCTLCQQ